MSAPSCSACNTAITGQGLEALGKKFHPDCFTCGKCRKAITGSFVDRNGPWHKECADEGRVVEKCETCGKPLEGRVIRALGKGYHADRCFRCHVCDKDIDGQFVTHEDRPLHAACVRHQSVSKGDCGGCGEGVFAGEPAVRLAGGELLHTRCFVCKECGKPFAQGEKYVLIEGAHLHATCSPNAVPCSVCGQKILEDHVKLGSAHYHHRCCKCDKCGRPADDNMVVLANKVYHIGECSAGIAGDEQ